PSRAGVKVGAAAAQSAGNLDTEHDGYGGRNEEPPAAYLNGERISETTRTRFNERREARSEERGARSEEQTDPHAPTLPRRNTTPTRQPARAHSEQSANEVFPPTIRPPRGSLSCSAPSKGSAGGPPAVRRPTSSPPLLRPGFGSGQDAEVP